MSDELPENDSSPSARTDLTGHELGDYSILRRLGSGGMAEVYLAEQRSLSRRVALKVLNQDLAADVSYVDRFKNEARAAASLVHPNIVQIYEVGQSANNYFIAQEYVAGKNLSQLLKRDGAFQPALVLDILRQVASALCKAYELAIVHRDIKPENLLLSCSGEVKVADFGLARVQSTDTKTLTQVGVAMGTPLYMSPEQVEGNPVDARSDIYSLGVSCYHLLAGVPPHTGDTALAIAVQHLHNTPEPLENVRSDVPSSLARVIHQMLAKKPESRPASPGELLAELRELATSAAEEGWASGPEDWSLADWIATEPARSRSSDELSRYMQAEAHLKPAQRRRRKLFLVLMAAALAGAVFGAMTRPSFYLANETQGTTEMPESSSAWAQLYHAQMTGGESNWKKVVELADADHFVRQIARRGLVRHYLIIEQNWRAAAAELRKLEMESQAEGDSGLLQAFSLAGLSICYEKLGRSDQATETQSKLDRRMRILLRDEEPQLYRLFESTVPQRKPS